MLRCYLPVIRSSKINFNISQITTGKYSIFQQKFIYNKFQQRNFAKSAKDANAKKQEPDIHDQVTEEEYVPLDDFVYDKSVTFVQPEIKYKTNPWTPTTKRTGLIAVKAFMYHTWDDYGVFLPVTVLQVHQCHVLQNKTQEKEGYTAVQVGAVNVKLKKARKSNTMHCAKFGVEPKRKICEFMVSPDALISPGTELTAYHFAPGQYVDVTGTSKGKGFAGVMKRWGFKGKGASHGVSLTHRHAGSTGQHQDPGRVWKGKKMAGHMGVKRRTVHNLFVHKVDSEYNLIYVVGSVPGPRGSFVLVKDAIKKPEQFENLVAPLPTYTGLIDMEAPSEIVAKPRKLPEEYTVNTPVVDFLKKVQTMSQEEINQFILDKRKQLKADKERVIIERKKVKVVHKKKKKKDDDED